MNRGAIGNLHIGCDGTKDIPLKSDEEWIVVVIVEGRLAANGRSRKVPGARGANPRLPVEFWAGTGPSVHNGVVIGPS